MSAANRRRSSLAGAPNGGERRVGLRAVGIAVSQLSRPIVGQRGGGVLARLKLDWPRVVGDEWAALAWPISLGREGVLKLRAAPVAALELQHRAPLLIERINLYFGRAAVSRLALVQGPLPSPAPAPPPPVPHLGADEARALDARLTDFADPELRAALARLGRAVLRARD